MKKILYLLTFFTFLFANNKVASAQGHIQFIHNSPDPALPAIDIYINGSLSFSNIKFRHATSFVSLPSSGILSIGIAPANMTIDDTLKNINITLQKDSFYYFITSGVLDTSQFEHNPDSVPINFTVNVFAHASGTSAIPYDASLQFFNGSTDAHLFNLYGREQRQMLFSKIGYGKFAPSYKDEITYQPVVIDLEDTGNKVLTTYLANFVGLNLEGHTAIIFSSGFRNPSLNQNGALFGLFAALYNGAIVPLTDTAIASLQLIHNAADPSTSSVDVYVNGILFTSYLYFRFATTFMDVPANTQLHIGLAPAGSSSAAEVTDSFTTTFNNAESYVGILAGVSGSGFAPNPNGRNIHLNLFSKSNARQIALDTSKVDFFIFNGSTDEPAIDVKLEGPNTILADSIWYGDTSGYSELLPKSTYNFDITSAVNSSNIFATYNADLSLYSGRALTIFTSGFVDSTNNNSGPGIGLFAALNDGNVVQFPLVKYAAQAQFINNIADPTLSSVAVFINGNSVINNLGFRKATYFSGIPAGTTINVGVAPSGSTSVTDTVANFSLTLIPGSTNVIMLNGVVHPGSFAANPEGANTSLRLSLINNAQTTAAPNTIDMRMVHGATDEPTNDFILDGMLPPLIDNIRYGDVAPYISVSAATHTYNMADAANDNSILKKYIALFGSYDGTSLTVFSSGFLNPATNQNGPAFGLYAADTSGNVFPLTDVTAVNNINSVEGIAAYPNPASGNVIITNKENSLLTLQLTDISGRQVKDLGSINNNSSKNFVLDEIPDGFYIIRATSSSGIQDLKLIIQK